MPDILISNDGPVHKIRMNRPEKKNALTLAMYETMAAAIEDAGKTDSVKCLLIGGAPDVFCAGNDLADFLEMARTGSLGAPIVRFLHALARCEKPLVAAVGGAAVLDLARQHHGPEPLSGETPAGLLNRGRLSILRASPDIRRGRLRCVQLWLSCRSS